MVPTIDDGRGPHKLGLFNPFCSKQARRRLEFQIFVEIALASVSCKMLLAACSVLILIMQEVKKCKT
ncbi:hypothetical protein ES332_A13G134500v1 [Gossypium tomentosum]|uniref:Uncharacterized protein n=1 Tax=Gossypium tomentosum TaxID=34277 RepID=A0A5D2MJX6_GOSTO|nr:hypothetical protein ES332_A13G134500v1 [Gossypium tomentosum]